MFEKLKKSLLVAATGTLSCFCMNASAAQIDVLFGYDLSSYDSAPIAQARALIEDSNIIYENSGVDIQLNFVGMEPIDFANFPLTTLDDHLLYSQNELRNIAIEKKADVVATLANIKQLPDNNGITNFTGWAYITTVGFYANSMVDKSAVGGYILAHEIGHNLGLNHSRAQNDTGGVRDNYGLGHGVDGKFVTVMAYSAAYNFAPKVELFSNPNLICKENLPCGVPNSADAARTLNETRLLGATYRSENIKEWNWNGGEVDYLPSDMQAFEADQYLNMNITAANLAPSVELTNVNVDADTNSIIKISTNNQTSSSQWTMYFSKNGSEYAVPFTMPNVGWYDTAFDMSVNPNWNGTVDSLRLAPAPGAAGNIRIDYLYMVAGNGSATTDDGNNNNNNEPTGNVSVFEPSDDTFVRSGQFASTNYAFDLGMMVKNAGGDFDRKAMMRFSTSNSIKRPVVSATLRMHVELLNTDAASAIAALHKIDDDWDEQDITYNNFPSFTNQIATFMPAPVGEWIEIDVTDAYNSSTGIKLAYGVENLSTGGKTNWRFSSSDSANPPQLVIVEQPKCVNYVHNQNRMTEISLNEDACIKVNEGLDGREISIGVSRLEGACTFRGTAMDAFGNSYNISSNWETFSGFQGTKIFFNVENGCHDLRFRVRID